MVGRKWDLEVLGIGDWPIEEGLGGCLGFACAHELALPKSISEEIKRNLA